MARTFNFYETLGLERDATEAQIRSAFRKLTFKHHPDRHSGDEQERVRMEERFQELTEAFNVLSRPESRARYDEELAQGQPGAGAAMDPREIARRLAARGAQTLKEGHVNQALSELKSALDHDSNCARAHYFMGLALGKVEGREKESLRHLERALAIEPTNATMMAETASAALRAAMKARAQRLAEQAMGLDPTNQKAAKVLRQIEESDSAPPAGDGLFGRLRRRG